MGEINWPLNDRHSRLPKWAQDEIHQLLCDKISRDMEDCVKADIRDITAQITGYNGTWLDEDLQLLAILARNAIRVGAFDDFRDSPVLDSLREKQTQWNIVKGQKDVASKS